VRIDEKVVWGSEVRGQGHVYKCVNATIEEALGIHFDDVASMRTC